MSHYRPLTIWSYKTLCLPLLGLVLFCFGCASRTTNKAASIKRLKKVEISAAELSSHNQSILALYASEIEVAADKVIREASSPVTRREALMWKAEAIPILQRSALKADPVAAVVDTWAFIFQMNGYMNQPLVSARLGGFLPAILDTLKTMDREMQRLILAAAPTADIPDLRRRLEEWAGAHPIEGGLAGRQSADTDLIGKANQSNLGGLASLNALQEGLGDITARLDSYNTYLPKQARWQAELLMSDLANDPQLGAAASNFAVLTRALDKTANQIDQMPETARTARNIALGDIQNERLAAQSFLTQERVQVVEALAEQRVSAMADLRRERLDATSDFRIEREVVFAAIHKEEMSAISDLRTLSQQTISDLDKSSRQLLDRLFWRAIALVTTTLLLSFLVFWILFRRLTSTGLAKRTDYRHAA